MVRQYEKLFMWYCVCGSKGNAGIQLKCIPGKLCTILMHNPNVLLTLKPLICCSYLILTKNVNYVISQLCIEFYIP